MPRKSFGSMCAMFATRKDLRDLLGRDLESNEVKLEIRRDKGYVGVSTKRRNGAKESLAN
jgi:hypothetical protein